MNYQKKFYNYVKKYDITNERIKYKYDHSFRVLSYGKRITKSLKLNRKISIIAYKSLLLHDIGRFKQEELFHVYEDKVSFDHGDVGYLELLNNNYIKEYTKNKYFQKIILDSVKNHNKLEIDPKIKGIDKTICQIVRDADKIDIMNTQGNTIADKDYTFNKEILKSFKERKLVDNKYVNNNISHTLRLLAFIFDLNFKESFIILKENKIIDQKLDLLSKYIDIKEIKEEINNYINEKLENI